ncbi:unnamed protein product [Mytilus edulis]|uniref:PHD-type domain-containing protein n=1 Tax=Mytilus edulis TaxID=6550 RepID=A0A8S3RRW4_MYTED|nr:unnamed protein product [Mytilus edulis]
MAAGVGGVLTALTIFTIFNRLLASPTEPVNTNIEYNIEDLGFYAARSIQTYLHRELLIDLLHPRVQIKQTRNTCNKNKELNTNCKYTTSICIRLLLLSGDVSLNPGPVKFPCGTCEKGVRKNQRAIQCDDCNVWFHLKCIDLPLNEYELLGSTTDSWFCKICYLPDFSDSYFIDFNEESNAPNDSLSSNSTSGVNKLLFQDLRETRRLHPKNFIAAYVNINSLRYKFDEVKDLLTDNIVDLLMIAESKLDNTFQDNLFQVEGYKLQRRDRNQYGGGLLTLIKSDFPSSRKQCFESDILENICYEIYINDAKWLIMGAYKPPSMKNDDFIENFTKSLDKCFVSYDNIIIFGDLNFDMLSAEKSQTLHDICDIFNLSQLVKGPTCFKKGCNPSLVDVIITNKKNLCFKTINSPNGVSDCHNIISTVVKGNLPAQKRRDVTYRSYKTFDIDEFTNDLQKIKISENCNEKDLNRIYDDYEEDFKNILNKHAPVKSRGQRKKPLPSPCSFRSQNIFDAKLFKIELSKTCIRILSTNRNAWGSQFSTGNA